MTVRLLHFTDLHLFADDEGQLKGVNTLAAFHSVLNLARVHHPKFHAAVFTGDLSQDGSAGAYERLAWALEQGPTPAYLLKGNHDDDGAMWIGLTGQKADIRRDRSFFAGRWQVLMLDSTVENEVHGALSATTLAWLDRALAAHPHHHVLICLHHQPVPVGAAYIDAIGLQNGADLFAVTDRYPHVRGVLWGHVHQEVDQKRHGVRLLSSPATCIQFARKRDAYALENLAPGYRWLELRDNGTLRTGVVRLPVFTPPTPSAGERLVG